ncbi:MAG TPA: DUF3800 domain-containing protein [Pyrinomonadaceae bacterium]|jgi:hypothetical protein
MYLIYVDESGDSGGLIKGGGTPFFVISGLIIHESHWNEIFQGVVDLRRQLQKSYGIPQRVGLHATDIVNAHGDFHGSQYGMTEENNFKLYRDVLEFLASLEGKLHILNVFILKNNILKRDLDVFEWGWRIFIQRFHNTLDDTGYLGGGNNWGLLISDRTHDDHLRKLMRQMRAFNYIKSKKAGTSEYYNVLVTRVLDDPIPRNSNHAYFVQLADMVAFALARRDFPRPKLTRHGFEKYFEILDPVLLKSANRNHPQGIVYWPT